jgi:hypothetical protein
MIVVRWIRAFVDFWVDFIVGDDWTVAASVLVSILATWGLERSGLAVWWLLPSAVLGSTTLSVRRAARRTR